MAVPWVLLAASKALQKVREPEAAAFDAHAVLQSLSLVAALQTSIERCAAALAAQDPQGRTAHTRARRSANDRSAKDDKPCPVQPSDKRGVDPSVALQDWAHVGPYAPKDAVKFGDVLRRP